MQDDYKLFDSKIVSESNYKKIIKTYYNYVLTDARETGKIYHLPNHCGFVGVFKNKLRTRFDYQYYKETGEKVDHHNRHSSGFCAFFKWDGRVGYATPNRDTIIIKAARMTFARKHTRALAKRLKEDLNINIFNHRHDR